MLVPLSSLSGLRIASSADPPQPVCPCVRVSCPSSTALPAPCSLLPAACSLPPIPAASQSHALEPRPLLHRTHAAAGASRSRPEETNARPERCCFSRSCCCLAHAALSLMLPCSYAPAALRCAALRCTRHPHRSPHENPSAGSCASTMPSLLWSLVADEEGSFRPRRTVAHPPNRTPAAWVS